MGAWDDEQLSSIQESRFWIFAWQVGVDKRFGTDLEGWVVDPVSLLYHSRSSQMHQEQLP
jgi:hypothetical protein